MGTNYYLIRKSTLDRIQRNRNEIFKYNVLNHRPSNEGQAYSEDNQYMELDNGYVYNGHYYASMEGVEITDILHIGKSSCGWRFLLASYPELGIYDFDGWKCEIENPDNYIIDEYNERVSIEELYDLLFHKKGVVTQEDVDKQNVSAWSAHSRDKIFRPQTVIYDSKNQLCQHSHTINSPLDSTYDLLPYADFS